ncbi:tautomerase family protein [Mycetocola spongiae]|uniref:tautomerase family protein n=1 Tax=Mycetocola spongiae TaxID=2859226 RepID=UPI001CF385BB|nr:tautomerase family protein [Mycetocola spongiae]UCR90315.1 tautomerase family protein [Mycetocola spongiae]
MAQFKIFGLDRALIPRREALSDALHGAAMAALGLPETKRFHRFFPMQRENLIIPADRGEDYTIIEVSLFAGRTRETKTLLMGEIFRRFETELGIAPGDVEITLTETPRENWGIRGLPGDELDLPYRVER